VTLVVEAWLSVGRPLWTVLGRNVTYRTYRFSVMDGVLGVLLVGLAWLRVRSLHRGKSVWRPLLVADGVVYVVFGIWVWGTSVYSWGSVANYNSSLLAGGLVLGSLLFAPLTASVGGIAGAWTGRRTFGVYRSSGGSWMVRGTAAAPAVWLLLWLGRLLLEDTLLKGYSVFLPLQPVPAVPEAQFLLVVLLVSEFYLFSCGFVVGSSIAIWRLRREGVEQLTRAPAPSRGAAVGAAGVAAGVPARPAFKVPTLLPGGFGARSGGQSGPAAASSGPGPARPSSPSPAGPTSGPTAGLLAPAGKRPP
jgi:hypothetical protein